MRRSLFILGVLVTAACSSATLTQPGTGDPLAPGEDGGSSSGTSGSPGTTSGGTPGTDGGVVTPAGPDTTTVIVEPTDHAQALLTAIQGAKTSIHMTMYLLDDPRFINALIQKAQAKVDVKVVLNKTFTAGAGSNASTFSQLQGGGVSVAWAPAAYTLTHEKCVIIDGAAAWIMTMNLEVTSSTKNREYLAVDTQAGDIAEAEAVFAADFSNAAVTPTGNLLVAPVNARDKLVALIANAKKTVDLEGEELSDYKIVNALIAAKRAGRMVRVVLAADPSPPTSQASAVAQLKAASIPVVALSDPYIHAKALVADGTSAYIGSENFTTGSLQYNRELGLITTNAASAAAVGQTIGQDIAAGSPL